jgi:predicted CoA-binding protein
MNYLLTSTAWRQEHNGYSHQNPSFVSGMLEKHNDFVKAYFPVDDNSMLAVMEETMASKNQMNIITAGKTPEPRWLTYDQAKETLKTGLLTWDFASDENPHVVLVGIGDYVTKEALAAIELIKKDAPEIRIRFVNICRLQAACSCEDVNHPQLPDAERYFTLDKPVIVTFHGYPEVMQAMLFHVKNPQRFSVHGYIEEGGTTTPFDMMVRNRTDRYHLAIEVLEKAAGEGVIDQKQKEKVSGKYEKALQDHSQYITKYSTDPAKIEQWQWEGSRVAAVGASAINHADILKNARTIAFIGLSDNPNRHSHRVAKTFQQKGYRIIPINPKLKSVLGEKSYAKLSDIPKDLHIDIVDIFRKSSEVLTHLDEVVERGGINTVWLAEGINTRQIEDFAEDYGLSMVTNFCILEAYNQIENT